MKKNVRSSPFKTKSHFLTFEEHGYQKPKTFKKEPILMHISVLLYQRGVLKVETIAKIVETTKKL